MRRPPPWPTCPAQHSLYPAPALSEGVLVFCPASPKRPSLPPQPAAALSPPPASSLRRNPAPPIIACNNASALCSVVCLGLV